MIPRTQSARPRRIALLVVTDLGDGLTRLLEVARRVRTRRDKEKIPRVNALVARSRRARALRRAPRSPSALLVRRVVGRVAERERADLIVMATRGRSRSAAILLGSVTEEVILQAQVPLLVVKHFGARLGVLQALLDRRFLHPGGLQTD